MRIFVDADACPVVSLIEIIAEAHQIPVTLVCDRNHVMHTEYSTVLVVDPGADAADLALINRVQKGDLVVTQDYGVATLALGKQAYVMHPTGERYTDDTIGQMLMDRHQNKKARRSSRHHCKGPKKRTSADDDRFAENFISLLRIAKQNAL